MDRKYLMHRKYLSDELPKVGDVVQMFDDAYGTGIITKFYGALVTLQRVYVKLDGGNPTIGIETVVMGLSVLRDRYPVYVTGPSNRIDNRSY